MHGILLYYLDKANKYNYEIISIIIDRVSINAKVAKKLLYQLNMEMEGNKVCIAETKLYTGFIHNRKINFLLFYII